MFNLESPTIFMGRMARTWKLHTEKDQSFLKTQNNLMLGKTQKQERNIYSSSFACVVIETLFKVNSLLIVRNNIRYIKNIK